jgi:hypothetical protein
MYGPGKAWYGIGKRGLARWAASEIIRTAVDLPPPNCVGESSGWWVGRLRAGVPSKREADRHRSCDATHREVRGARTYGDRVL